MEEETIMDIKNILIGMMLKLAFVTARVKTMYSKMLGPLARYLHFKTTK